MSVVRAFGVFLASKPEDCDVGVDVIVDQYLKAVFRDVLRRPLPL
jgi:hypothetical protein